MKLSSVAAYIPVLKKFYSSPELDASAQVIELIRSAHLGTKASPKHEQRANAYAENQLNTLLTDKKTHIAESVSGNFTSLSNGNAESYGAWAQIGLLQFAQNLYAIDGTGVRFKIKDYDLLSPELSATFKHLDESFRLKVEEAREKIIILDYGSQYTGNILSTLRRQGYQAEIYDHTTTKAELQERIDSGEIKGIILSGGPDSVYNKNALSIDPEFFKNPEIPVLGICYGMQLMAKDMGGIVSKSHRGGEFGPTKIRSAITDDQKAQGQNAFLNVFNSNAETVIMSHSDSVTTVPEGFIPIASTDDLPIAAMANPSKNLYGLQFHPEVSKKELLDIFARDIVGLEPEIENDKSLIYDEFIDKAVKAIQETVGDKHVLLGLSGGVDSTVLAYLLDKALAKEQLHFCLVDHGFMREGEIEELTKTFKDKFGDAFKVINSEDENFENLDKALAEKNKKKRAWSGSQALSSKQKRKVIGSSFIDVFQREAQALQDQGIDLAYIAQGTILSDIMESGKKKITMKNGKPVLTQLRDEVKAHHNVGGLPDKIHSRILEPIRDLLKNEVRELGRRLGLPDEAVNRQPFPGPGLAIRTIADHLTKELVSIARKANYIFDGEMKSGSKALAKIDWKEEVFFQYYAGLFDTSSKLFSKDESTRFSLPRNLMSTIESLPMAQKFKDKGYEMKLALQAFEVVGTKGDSRHARPPLVIQYYKDGKVVPLKDNPDLKIVDLRTLAREIANNQKGISRVFYQVGDDNDKQKANKAIAMRAVDTIDVMTANVVDVSDILETTAAEIKSQIPEIARVFYDITDKPPSTIEFE